MISSTSEGKDSKNWHLSTHKDYMIQCLSAHMMYLLCCGVGFACECLLLRSFSGYFNVGLGSNSHDDKIIALTKISIICH